MNPHPMESTTYQPGVLHLFLGRYDSASIKLAYGSSMSR